MLLIKSKDVIQTHSNDVLYELKLVTFGSLFQANSVISTRYLSKSHEFEDFRLTTTKNGLQTCKSIKMLRINYHFSHATIARSSKIAKTYPRISRFVSQKSELQLHQRMYNNFSDFLTLQAQQNSHRQSLILWQYSYSILLDT